MCSSRFRAFGALMLATTLALVASLLWNSPVDAAPNLAGHGSHRSLHVRSSPHSKAPSVGDAAGEADYRTGW